MAGRIGLALALHNQQPVGNFGWVIDETYERAYLPMLEALERHAGVRVALHYSGPLLSWLEVERPSFLDRLRALVTRGQVEIVGGGWYEPVLAALPERDRIGQLGRMADELERLFGARPTGAWLAERVWEPDLPTSLTEAGYRWTVLDDAHFRAAAIPEEALWGPYTTDDQGRVLTVFGTEQGLRYRIPFAEVDDVIGWLRLHATEAGDRVGTMGDDGEKFGAWPTTFAHCWTDRWVDRFFTALEANRDWLRTVTPSEWLVDHGPIGRVYLPTGSYAEMGEWALPADEGRAFVDAMHEARSAGRPEARWLRGAIWRNFQIRYREINDLHKQMLRASELVEAMPPGPDRDRAADHLYAGQSNDPYWHGLFGGIYLPDLRVAALGHLIAAEDIAASATGGAETGRLVDLDLDGREEALLATDGQFVAVKPDEGAGIGRWDIRAARHPLAAVMRRRPEAYHETLRAYERRTAASTDGASPGEPPASIHDIVAVKQSGLSERLVYDDHERRSGLLRFFAPETTADDVAAGRAHELGDFLDTQWTLERLDEGVLVVAREGSVRRDADLDRVAARTTIEVGGGRLDPTLTVETSVTNTGDRRLDVLMAVEWNVMLLGGGANPGAWHEVDGTRTTHDARFVVPGVDRLSAGNDQVGVTVTTQVEPPADAWTAPIETVSNSEGGFELVYQGSTTMFVWALRLGPGDTWTVRVAQQVTSAVDRTADERAVPAATTRP